MTELRILNTYLSAMDEQRQDMVDAIDHNDEEYLDLLCGLGFAIAKLKHYADSKLPDPLTETKWYQDEKLNGDPKDILKYIFQCDVQSAGADTLIKALLLSRIPTPPDSRSALKPLPQADLLEIAQYYYSDVTIEQIKEIKKTFVSTKDRLEQMSYPTSAFYRESYLDKLEEACEPYVPKESALDRAHAILKLKK